MSKSNTKLLETGAKSLAVPAGETLNVVAQHGDNFRVVQGDELASGVLAIRDGNDLVLHYQDGSKIVIEQYFVVCEEGGCEISLPQASEVEGQSKAIGLDEAIAESIQQQADPEQPGLTLEKEVDPSNPTIVYVDGDTQTVMNIVRGDKTLSAALDAAVSGNNDSGTAEWFSYWPLVGLGTAFALYHLLQDDSKSPLLPVFEGGETATVSVDENGAAKEVVFDAKARLGTSQDMAIDADITYSIDGADASAFSIDAQTGELTLLEPADFEAKASYSVNVTATSDLAKTTATQKVVVSVVDQPLILEGEVVAGPVVAGHGLDATAYAADGTELGSAKVNDDGFFSIEINRDNYKGPVLINVHDSNPEADYLHEGTGGNADLTADLRAVGEVEGEGRVRVNVNIFTETSVRQLLDDRGGDAGNAPTKLGAITGAMAEAQNVVVLKAFGLDPEIDLGSVDPHPVNADGFADASANEQALGRMLAVFAAAEVTLGVGTGAVLEKLADGSKGGVLAQDLYHDLEAAAALADTVSGNEKGTAAFLKSTAQSGVASIAISSDSGTSATDFLTNVSAQTINATLIKGISGDQAVYGSVDGGENWVDIAKAASGSVSGTAVSWSVSLSATASTQQIVIAVTDDGAKPESDANNVVGRGLAQNYILDQTAPSLPSAASLNADENGVAVGSVVATDANGIPATGAYALSGTDAALFAIDDAGVLTFKSAQDFENPADANKDGVYNIDVNVMDVAGNTGTKSIAVNLQNVNEKPTVAGSGIAASTAVVGQSFSLQTANAFTDPDAGDVLTYSATGLPSGLTINSASGVITGTATMAAASALNVTVTATDKDGLNVSDTFALSVLTAPSIASIAGSGGLYTFDVTFTEAVTVASGTPTLILDINGNPTPASYSGGSGTKTLTFEVAAIPAGDGNSVTVKAINLASSTVVSKSTGLSLLTNAVGQTTTDLTIDDTNPGITTTTLSANENSKAVGTVAATDTNGILSNGGYAIAGGADAALFTIDNAGVLTFKNSQDFENPADANKDGIYHVDVNVTDVVGNTGTKSIAVNLQNVNEAPTVAGSGIAASTAVVGQSFSLQTASAFTDVDANDVLTYSATGLPNGLTIDGTTGAITGTATAAAAATTVTVTATDNSGANVSDTFSLSVVAAPIINSIAGSSGTSATKSGGAYTFAVTFSEAVTLSGSPTLTLDINGTSTTAAYKSGSGTNTLTFEVAATPAGDGNSVTINAINVPSGASITGVTTQQPLLTNVVGQTTKDLNIDDTAPGITTTTLSANENGTTVGSVVASDTNGIPASGAYSLSGTDAALFTIDNAGVLTFTNAQDFENPGDAGANGVYDIDVSVTDVAGNTGTKSIAVNLQDVNEAPTVAGSGIAASTAVVGQSFSLQTANAFTDVDANDVLTYSATGLPSGLTIDGTTGVITGTATAAAASALNVTVTATDNSGANVSDTFSLSVVAAPSIASIAGSGGASITQSGGAFTFDVTFSEAVTVAGTPTLTLDINGTSTTAAYKGGTSSNTLTFEVAATPAGDGNSVTINAINMPTGASITGVTTQQPLLTSVVGQTTQDLTIDDTDPGITTTTLSANENGTTVGSVVASDANGIPASGAYSLSGTDAALFTIDNAGVLTFTNAQDFENPGDAGANGVYDIDVSVTDVAGNTGTKSITVNLQDVNEAPTVAGSLASAAAVVNQAFNLPMAGAFADVDANDVLTYSATGLPSGLTIDGTTGVITGTATTAATATNVTVTATDKGGLKASGTLSLAVHNPPTATSQINGVTNVDVQSNIVLTFGEDITLNTGQTYTATIKDLSNPNGAKGLHDDVTQNDQTITLTAGMVNKNTLTLNPDYDLDFGSNYEVIVDAGAFTGVTTGLASLPVTTGGITFTTVTPTQTGELSQAQDAAGALQTTYTYIETDGQGRSGVPEIPKTFDASGADYAFVARLIGFGGGQGNEAFWQVSNFDANPNNALTLGDIIYYDNQGLDNPGIYSGLKFNGYPKPTNLVADGITTKFSISGANGFPNKIEIMDYSVSADIDGAWAHFTNFPVSPVLVA